jgi:ubiquitin-protein ligase
LLTNQPFKDDIRNLKATIVGPVDSVYEGFEFELKIYVPQDYPMVPPVVSFVTKIFHPNVMFKVSTT